MGKNGFAILDLWQIPVDLWLLFEPRLRWVCDLRAIGLRVVSL